MSLSVPPPGRFRAILAERLGLELSSSFDHRLEQAWGSVSMGSTTPPEQHLAALEAQPISSPLWQAAIGRVTVAESRFLRDRAWWHQIETVILARLIIRAAAGQRRLRLWSAACAGGEEPYTLAMLVDRLLPDRRGWDVRIFGTDINQHGLEAARKGRFGPWAVRELDAHLLQRHFVERATKRFELAADLRAMVEFRCLNLVDPDPAFVAENGPFDLILCRNVLMYWSRERQRHVAAWLVQAAAVDGWIVSSPAESGAELFAPMVVVNTPDAIFFHKRDVEEDRPVPSGYLPKRDAVAVKRPSRPSTPVLPREIGVRPGSPVASLGKILEEARRHADRGEFDLARRQCAAALARDAVNWEANSLLAHVCEEAGDLAGALSAARRGVYLRPDSAMAHFRLGNAQLKAGRADQARTSFRTVTRLLADASALDPVEPNSEMLAGTLLQAATSCLRPADMTVPTPPVTRTFDWAAIHAKLAAAEARLAPDHHISAEERAAILRERARLLAHPAEEIQGAEDLAFIEFEVDDQRYAIEASQTDEVIELGAVTPVPGLPDFYIGVINRRGAVYPLVDLRRLFNFRIGSDEPFRFAILLAGSGRVIAAGAHAVTGLSRWPPDSVSPAAGQTEESPTFAGLLADGTPLLEANRIIHDARLLVDDQPKVAGTRGG